MLCHRCCDAKLKGGPVTPIMMPSSGADVTSHALVRSYLCNESIHKSRVCKPARVAWGQVGVVVLVCPC